MQQSPSPYTHALQSREYSSPDAHIAKRAIARANAHAVKMSAPCAAGSDLYQKEKDDLDRAAIGREEMAAMSSHRRACAIDVVERSGVPLAETACELDVFHAACDGDAAMIKKNLDSGVDINALGQPHPGRYDGQQFEKRWTFYAPPIVFAAAFGRERAVRALVLWGANVLCESSTGLIAREYAEHRGYATIVAILEEAEAEAKQGEAMTAQGNLIST